MVGHKVELEGVEDLLLLKFIITHVNKIQTKMGKPSFLR